MTDQNAALQAPHTALLVMDFQAAIVARVPGADELLERARAAIDLVRDWGGQVGYVRVAFDDADFDALPATSAMAAAVASRGRGLHSDSPATAIDAHVAPEPGDIVVRKTRVGAFSTTDLDRQLRDRGVTTLILAGLSTSGVLLSTVRDAADRDYRVLVLADVSADPDPEVHAFLTTRIFPRQARVITLAELDGVLSAGADAAS
jgi:nicotinamidase-related amidase